MRHHTTTTWLLLPTANDNGTKTSDYLSGKYSDGAKEHWVNTKKKKKKKVEENTKVLFVTEENRRRKSSHLLNLIFLSFNFAWYFSKNYF